MHQLDLLVLPVTLNQHMDAPFNCRYPNQRLRACFVQNNLGM